MTKKYYPEIYSMAPGIKKIDGNGERLSFPDCSQNRNAICRGGKGKMFESRNTKNERINSTTFLPHYHDHPSGQTADGSLFFAIAVQ